MRELFDFHIEEGAIEIGFGLLLLLCFFEETEEAHLYYSIYSAIML